MNLRQKKKSLKVFEVLQEDLSCEVIESKMWKKVCSDVTKKITKMKRIQNKLVYIETLSVASIKRTVLRLYENICHSRTGGYDVMLSEEEQRCLVQLDQLPVEGFY